MKIEKGMRVLLRAKGKDYLVKAGEGSLHTNAGKFDLSELVGMSFGVHIKSSSGERGYIFYPTLYELMMKVKRKTQIIYPKDAAYIMLRLGLTSGARVAEIGAGSGALTIALASTVGEKGKVYSYDFREEFLHLARENVERAGFLNRVEFKLREAEEGFDEKELDAVFIDLPSPWLGVKSAWNALRGGGTLGSLSPTYNQVEKMVKTLKDNGFEVIESIEIFIRHILAREGKTRPQERMISHTGFLTFARKILT